MSLTNQRASIQHLISSHEPVDAQAAYYALHHATSRSKLVVYPDNQKQPTGYLCFSRTGYDLFSPLITMRLPDEMNDGYALIDQAISADSSVILARHPNMIH